MKKTKRKGHCCKAFSLPYSPAGLERFAQRSAQKDELAAADNKLVASMVIYLGRFRRNPAFPEIRNPGGARGHFYTCKYLKRNGDCTIYEKRPFMCRQYPNWHECQYTGCDCTAARQARRRTKRFEEAKKHGFDDIKEEIRKEEPHSRRGRQGRKRGSGLCDPELLREKPELGIR